jgi:hypothetical protein
MAITAGTPQAKPALIDPTKTSTLPISNGTPAAAAVERIAERHERWLLTMKKLDVPAGLGLVEINPNKTVEFNFEVRRQGWTTKLEMVFYISSWKASKPTVTATLNMATDDDPTGQTFEIVGTPSKEIEDAIRYAAVLDIGAGDRTDEQTLTNAIATIETSNEDASDVYVYGRSLRQLPFAPTTMELAP